MSEPFNETHARAAVLYMCVVFDDWQTQGNENAIRAAMDKLRQDVRSPRDMTGISGFRSHKSLVAVAHYDGLCARPGTAAMVHESAVVVENS